MSSIRTKRNFKFYLAELLILVIGITLSFWLNDWREGKAEQNLEFDTLSQFRENMKNDSSVMSQNIELLATYVKTYSDLLLLEKNSLYQDSLSAKLVLVMSYFNFRPVDITYQEMQGLGNSRIIQDKALLNGIVELYNGVYGGLKEYLSADKNFNLNLMMPFITKNLPYAINFDFSSFSPAEKRRLMSVITSDEMKHLIQLDLVFKSASKVQFELCLNSVSELLRKIDNELAED